jgi:GNAT superfamily N-acetyltransferase
MKRKKLEYFLSIPHSKIIDNRYLISIDLSPNINDKSVSSAILNRVFTPPKLRGKGHAREAMGKMLQLADDLGITIYLDINPYGDMDYQQLEDWYKRLGFKEWNGAMKRIPKNRKSKQIND